MRIWRTPTRSYTLRLEQHGATTAGQGITLPFVIPLAMGLLGRDGGPLALQLEDFLLLHCELLLQLISNRIAAKFCSFC